MDIQKLENLLKSLDNKFYINEGGCCYVAYIIAKYLDKLNIPYSLIIYNRVKISLSNKDVIYNIKNNIGNYPIRFHTCNHYTLKIGNIIINTSQGYRYSYELKNITHKDIRMIYNRGCWNPTYRIRHNENVRKSIHNFFKPYEKEKEK